MYGHAPTARIGPATCTALAVIESPLSDELRLWHVEGQKTTSRHSAADNVILWRADAVPQLLAPKACSIYIQLQHSC